ncbi:hypothetical protein BGX38DRAFT_1139675 [Terfezia claveryi]|nr:hypothetical protein BGX38DRAFT_1139675 [Terfezia claveryi]
MANPLPNYVVIGDSMNQLRDEVLKMENQPGTAQHITNATNALDARIGAIFPVLETIVGQLGVVVNRIEAMEGRIEAMDGRIHGVEGQLQTLNQQYNLQHIGDYLGVPI